ncbi:hypothetical protein KY363_06155 [Candidatus Woesearchaeota archaeon]|nr:hypothetical protein [Candidatus Woesearchaeota archaeon]
MVILFDQYHLPEDIFEVVFATEQQVIVGRLLVEEFKHNNGTLGKTEMSLFANKLHEGTVMDIIEDVGPVKRTKQVKVSYNKRQFYDRILTPMRSMGMIDYDMYKKKYLLSDRFNNAVKKVGMLWIQELNKPLPR